MSITKCEGVTSTERLLSELCDNTFLKLWSFPNPIKDDGKELCDLLAVFENHAFIFFDRESKRFDNSDKDVFVNWTRWSKEVIAKQVKTSFGAERYLQSGRDIFLDEKLKVLFPLKFSRESLKIHRIVVAHGAKEACEQFSEANVSGSLAISYGKNLGASPFPFMVHLDSDNPVHILDSHNLKIVLSELDTFCDFTAYIEAKEKAICKLDFLSYCGEEDLLAHYFINFDSKRNEHFIGVINEQVNGLLVAEGEWEEFRKSGPYARKKASDKASYFWDELIQRTCQHALDGELMGNGDVMDGPSAIHEMAKEPRFIRRELAKHMIQAIQRFPENDEPIVRKLSGMPSIDRSKFYAFLQLKHLNIQDYDNDYRPKRQQMLDIACGAIKNKTPHLEKVVGIAIDAPKFTNRNSEDFILLPCKDWPKEIQQQYEKDNELFGFLKQESLQIQEKKFTEFPVPDSKIKKRKVGRNEKCPCGSGLKYKKCCGN